MPRPPDPSRLRRFLMQTIMWLILGATIGLAALVDHRQHKFLSADLGEPRQFEGFSIRLPSAWSAPEDQRNPQAVVEVAEPYFDYDGRVISVTLKQPSLVDAVSALAGAGREEGTIKLSEKIPMGDGMGTLMVRKLVVQHPLWGMLYSSTNVTASRTLPSGKMLIIELTRGGGRSNKKQQDRDVELMKRIAAAVKIDTPQ
jgi:hypothetical protein